MHPRSLHFPSQAQLVFPLLALAEEAGGQLESKVAYRALADKFALPDALRQGAISLPCGQRHKLWERHVRFVKERAKDAGYLTSATRGLWQLTDEGSEAVRRADSGVVIQLVVDEEKNLVGAQVHLSVGLPTVHTLHCGDARDMSWIGSGEIPLIVTSIPYFDLKEYDHVAGQLADVRSYDDFVAAMTDAMRECYRVLMPGGRAAINVGDVLRSRSKHGTHEVLPLHADMLVGCRRIGFQALTGILWHKFSNCRYEEGAGGVLGQPSMPRMVIKSESESILLFKKPGPNFSATPAEREASRISKADWQRWVRPIWSDVPGAKATARHPAPWPVEVPYRLIRMNSYSGPMPQTVLDPFGGEFNTSIAAMRAQRSSVGNELSPRYVEHGIAAVHAEAQRLLAASNPVIESSAGAAIVK